LPIIMLTGEEWDPVNVRLGNRQSREQQRWEELGLWSLEYQKGKWQQWNSVNWILE
jgi:hypothetical protein